MADYDDLYGSRFLGAADLKGPAKATIDRVEEEVFSRDGKSVRAKAVLYFRGASKPIVLNKTNASTLAHAYGKDFSDWPGKMVEVRPETTTFNGKVVAALRLYPISATKIEANSQIKHEQKQSLKTEINDEIPW
jgi:hypothetical protein